MRASKEYRKAICKSLVKSALMESKITMLITMMCVTGKKVDIDVSYDEYLVDTLRKNWEI